MKPLFRFLALSVLVLGFAASAQQVIRIGVVGPMAFIQGEHHWRGATLAAEEINAAGGIQAGDKTYRIELVRVDTNEMLSVTDAVSAVERAITASKVDFLVGGFRTEAVFPMTEVAADHRKIFLIAGAAADELLKGRVDKDYARYKYLFRVTPMRSTSLARLSFLILTDVIEVFRAELGIEQPKVAIVAERLDWANAVVTFVELMVNAPLPYGLGAKHVGTWRPSAVATSVTPELTAIERAGTHIIFTALSGPAGVPFGRDWGRLQIPAAVVGVNVEAMSQGWLEATGGFGAYVATVGIYAQGVALTEATVPFVEGFAQRFGGIPLYTAGTYDAIHILANAIRQAGSLQADAVIKALEATDYPATMGRVVFDALHDVTWGLGYATGIGVQWQNGELRAFWPREWRPEPATSPDLVVGYPGTVPYQIPPWVVQHWRPGGK
ncbi:MAG: ABC transporter substrate-binding protein [Candidatus Bipolaricaulota bacterium]